MRVPHVDFGGITKVSGVSSPYQTAKGATPEAFGAGPARALIQGGQTLTKEANTLGKIALDIQQEDNESEAEKLDAEAMRRVRIESYGGQLDPNSEMKKGYYNLRNDEAVAQTGAFQAAIKKHYDDVLATASNDAVKRMLSKVLRRDTKANLILRLNFTLVRETMLRKYIRLPEYRKRNSKAF